MRRIKDEELRKYQEEVGRMEYRKTSIYFFNLSKRIRQNNLRASREHYENSEERLNEIKEKYKNGVTMDILNEMFNVNNEWLEENAGNKELERQDGGEQ